MPRSYVETVRIQSAVKLRELLKDLPPFASEYFRAISNSKQPKTKVAYALDLRIFFNFLKEEVPYFMEKEIKSLSVSDLEHVTIDMLEEFAEYLSYYVKNLEYEGGIKEREYTNEARGKSRKLVAIRMLFAYLHKRQRIGKNVSELLDMPKIKEKAIIALEAHEVAKLLDEVDSGGKLSGRQQKYHEYTKSRDVALMTLLLGTGMRVSEVVGIDLSDVDFSSCAVKIYRKGGKEAVLYFGDEVKEALSEYMSVRKYAEPQPGHENALFLSMQNKRLTDRAIQNLVKKYAKTVTTLKNISPHKLRSTYGTSLYRETGDIYLVADVLGHKDVNTTKKHYVRLDDDRRRAAANAVKLRED